MSQYDKGVCAGKELLFTPFGRAVVQAVRGPDAALHVFLWYEAADVEDKLCSRGLLGQCADRCPHMRAAVKYVDSLPAGEPRHEPRSERNVVGGGGQGRALVVGEGEPLESLCRQPGAPMC